VAANETGPVGHHFNNLKQQQSTVRFGMWLFLVTEVLFFAGAFCAYTAYRVWYPNEFEAGSMALNVGIAALNTFLLLASSFTITLGIRSAYTGDIAGLRRWLMATIVLGTVFLGFKAREYYIDYEEHLVPGDFKKELVSADGRKINREQFFVEGLRARLDHVKYKYIETGPYAAPVPDSKDDKAGYAEYLKNLEAKEKDGAKRVNFVRVQLFFMFYYSMTGLHVLHMIVGLGLLLWQYILAWTGFFNYNARYIYVEVMSLYWHFVDMVWIFLLPLLYLAGPHTLAKCIEDFQHAIGMGGH
jgi:cytochrome c oxidase subunit III